MGMGEFNAAMDWHPIQGGVEILLVTSCYRNGDNLRSDGPLACIDGITVRHKSLLGNRLLLV